jgi:hypothetical protein
MRCEDEQPLAAELRRTVGNGLRLDQHGRIVVEGRAVSLPRFHYNSSRFAGWEKSTIGRSSRGCVSSIARSAICWR